MTRVQFGFFEGESQSGGYTISIGEITSLHKQIGDVVKEGDVIADVDTDKAKIEILAPVSGIICSYAYEEGEEWNKSGEIRTPHGILFMPAIGEIETDTTKHSTSVSEEDFGCESNQGDNDVSQDGAPLGVETCDKTSGLDVEDAHITITAVPSARVVAREHHIDLEKISGTGPDGVIQCSDVIQATTETSPRQCIPSDTGNKTVLKTSMARKTTARLLEYSQRTIPQTGGWLKIDVTNLCLFRKNCNTHYGELMSCAKLRYDHVFMYLAVKLLGQSQFLILNGYWDEKEEAIVQYGNINIGIAVNTSRGLVVPVIHCAEKLSFAEFIRATEGKIDCANNGTLLPQDFYDLTFTVNNAGALGVEIPDPIVPSVIKSDNVMRSTGMILALGNIVQQDGRYYMYSAFKFDHRLVDALEPSRFMGAIKQFIESRKKLEDFYELFDENFSL